MKIVKITIFINGAATYMKVKTRSSVVQETAKTLIFFDGSRLLKSKLESIQSIFKNSISSTTPTISYFTYCTQDRKDIMISALKSKVYDRITELQKGMDNLNENIKKL